MRPYIPLWNRPPNKFIRYEERRFTAHPNLTGTERIAIFKDKNGNVREEMAQVIWDGR